MKEDPQGSVPPTCTYAEKALEKLIYYLALEKKMYGLLKNI